MNVAGNKRYQNTQLYLVTDHKVEENVWNERLRIWLSCMSDIRRADGNSRALRLYTFQSTVSSNNPQSILQDATFHSDKGRYRATFCCTALIDVRTWSYVDSSKIALLLVLGPVFTPCGVWQGRRDHCSVAS